MRLKEKEGTENSIEELCQLGMGLMYVYIQGMKLINGDLTNLIASC